MPVKTPARKTWSVKASADRVRWFAFPNGDNPAAVLPSWAPAAGASVTYQSDGAVLTNTFRSVVTTDGPFEAVKLRRAYSGTFYIPGWRGVGGLLIIGGGHANTNHNAVYIVTLGATLYFERLVDATVWTAGVDGDIIAGGELNTYGEKIGSSPVQIAQGHSYHMRVVGADGVSLWCVIRQAVMRPGSGGNEYQAAHSLDLSTPETASSARGWVRETSDLGAWTGTASPGFLARHGGRAFLMTRGSGNMRWFDMTAKSWVTGSGAGWGYPSSDTDGGDPISGTLFAVPERDLIVATYRQGGNLVVQYARTTDSQPAAATATLSTTLAIPVEGGKACVWHPYVGRILVYGVTGNNDRCYRIEIPATLTDTWTVDSEAITGDPIDPVAIMTRVGWGCHYHAGSRSIVMLHGLKHATGGEVDTIDRLTFHRPLGA